MILLQTTRIEIQRQTEIADPYEDPDFELTTFDPVPAHVSSVTGTGQRVGGAAERIDAQLYVSGDVDVRPGDVVMDLQTERAYTVLWSLYRAGLGLKYRKAGLVATRGQSNG